jgi:O-antigen biosynthesis protein
MEYFNFYDIEEQGLDLSIIIVNYNVADELKNCINSIKCFLNNINYEIIVVDNNSAEDKIKKYPQIYLDVKFIFSDDNLGYGQANNLGVGYSKGDFILILNPDTIFIEDTVIPLITFIKENPSTGAVTPMLVYGDMTFQYSFGMERGVVVEYLDSLYVFNNLFERYKKKELDKYISKRVPFQVGWISGAFMLMRKDIYKEVGGFSQEYKLNYEDMDLCFKLRKKGYNLYYFPEHKCVHIESVSQRKDFYNYIYYRYKGRLYFLKNHFSLFHYNFIRLFQIFGLLLRLLFSFFVFTGDEAKQRRKAFRDSIILYLKF